MKDQTIAVVGLGLLGRSIAACLLGHGFRVVGYAIHRNEHEEAQSHIAHAITELVDRGGFSPHLREDWRDRFTPVTAYEPLADCGFVIESVREDPAVKQRVFDQIEAAVDPQAPIASNTSAIPISDLQRPRRYPRRFLGMHWAEPAHATRFMELIRGEQTSDEAFAAAADLARHLGKEPCLVQKDVPAFVVNRLGYAMYREALHLLETGVADAQTIDTAFRNACGLWASICGPFRWIDLTGGPAAYGPALQRVLPTLSNATQLPRGMVRLMEQDARGILNGRGFYQYSDQEAAQWKKLYAEHVWTVRQVQDRYFPMTGDPRCD